MLESFDRLSTPTKLIIIAIVVLLLILIWRKYGGKIEKLFQKKTIDPMTVTLQNGQTVTLTTLADLPESQKRYLEGLSTALKKDIYGANITHKMELYSEAAQLSDVEVDYLAQYYKRNAGGNSLYDDMNNELESCIIQDCSGWEQLIAKLEKTGNR